MQQTSTCSLDMRLLAFTASCMVRRMLAQTGSRRYAQRQVHVQVPWERYDPSSARSFVQWLPGWGNDLVSAAGAECSWCVMHLPELHPQLELRLLAAVFAKLEGGFRTRLAAALGRGESPSGIIAAISSFGRAGRS